MWKIWANKLLPKAYKSCPKLKKSPNLVTLLAVPTFRFTSIVVFITKWTSAVCSYWDRRLAFVFSTYFYDLTGPDKSK